MCDTMSMKLTSRCEVCSSWQWCGRECKNAPASPASAPIEKKVGVGQRGRPPVGEQTKQRICLRLDPDVIEKFKSTGEGWQARINQVLKKAQL
jgi:uncharacterized protein (DUF4415 family)